MSSRRGRSRRALRRLLGVTLLPRMRPDKVLRARAALRRWGLTPAGAYAVAAIRTPKRTAIIDEHGALTFSEVHERTDALAHALQRMGLRESDTVAIMCANHRGFIEATVACTKLAADILYLDPHAGAGELAETLRRESPRLMIHDETFTARVRALPETRERLIARCEPGRAARHPSLEQLIAEDAAATPAPPANGQQSTITLTANGAGERTRRRLGATLMTESAACSRIPLRPREPTMIAAPLCGAWGFLHLTLALRLGSTLLLRREFQPIETLAAVDRHGVTALALLPDMLAQIMALPRQTIAWYATEHLEVIAVRGPTLPGELAIPAREHFGDVLYNLGGRSVINLETGWPWPTPTLSRPAHAA